ncbi:hypothetical protein KP509_31G016200 [Ceratopteris richardii]|uniref:RING-type domain-containing protein n=1 Tax=Ceratopteris richardii TaxID=49495 RepID=A0A8T2QVR5_CERRI|nr:hypothetical protein KP509_31G016200 [Ceratopteris richardii]
MAGGDVDGTQLKKQVPFAGPTFSCSVCLETASEDSEARTTVKLMCGHHFHLDCIGSAFNAKGRMQCPNCRQVEPGVWHFANGCGCHEDSVNDLTLEEDVEAYGYRGAVNLHFSPGVWCPHQDIDLRQGSRVPTSMGQICPYLVFQGLPWGGPAFHADDYLGFHTGLHRPRGTRRAAIFHATQRSYGQQQASATSNGMSVPYEGLQNFRNTAPGYLQPDTMRQQSLGFLAGNPQSVHPGVNQGSNINSGHGFGQLPLVRSTQGLTGTTNPHSHLLSTSRSSFASARRTRQSDMPSTPQRVSSSDVAWTGSESMHDYSPVVSSDAAAPSPLIRGDALGWMQASEAQVDPWVAGIYVPQPSAVAGSGNWWAWVPSVNNHAQRLVTGGAPSSFYHEGQVFSPGLFGSPRATQMGRFSGQPSEGSYAWGYSGFV